MQLSKNGLTIEVQDAEVVDLVLQKLSGREMLLGKQPLPAIGEYWPGQGGIFAGLMRGHDGGKDYALILGPMLEEGTFEQQQDRAAVIDIDGHRDFRCPRRKEQSLLFANLGDQFEHRWYWSCERLQGDEGHAWMQNFFSGTQNFSNVNNTGLGCAVRGILL